MDGRRVYICPRDGESELGEGHLQAEWARTGLNHSARHGGLGGAGQAATGMAEPQHLHGGLGGPWQAATGMVGPWHLHGGQGGAGQ